MTSDEPEKRERSKKIRAEVDRIEDGGTAVIVVGKESFDVPTSLLPDGAEGGDHLDITITLDAESRAASEDKVKAMQERLLKKSGTEGKKDFKL